MLKSNGSSKNFLELRIYYSDLESDFESDFESNFESDFKSDFEFMFF